MGRSCRNNCVAVFGFLKLMVGLGMIAMGILNILYGSWSATFCQGLWGGFWVVSTGLVGVCGGCCRSKGMNMAFMMFAMFSNIIVAAGTIVISLCSYFVDTKYTVQSHWAVVAGWPVPNPPTCYGYGGSYGSPYAAAGYGPNNLYNSNPNYNNMNLQQSQLQQQQMINGQYNPYYTTQMYNQINQQQNQYPVNQQYQQPNQYNQNNQLAQPNVIGQNNYAGYNGYGYGYATMPPDYFPCPNSTAAIFNLVLTALAGAVAVMSIISAPLACCAACSCCGGEVSPESPPQMVRRGDGPMPPQNLKPGPSAPPPAPVRPNLPPSQTQPPVPPPAARVQPPPPPPQTAVQPAQAPANNQPPPPPPSSGGKPSLLSRMLPPVAKGGAPGPLPPPPAQNGQAAPPLANIV